MRDIMLIVHFIGLAMGIGTSFAFMFLGRAGARMEEEEALTFKLNSFTLSRMGHVGLTLLIISGGYLMTPYWRNLTAYPLLIAKLLLVLLLAALIGIMSSTVRKARDDMEKHLKKIETLGNIALLTGLIIVILAVYNFN